MRTTLTKKTGSCSGFRSRNIRNKRTTILLVENDVSTAVPVLFSLQDQGFRVLHATDGRLGLELARAAQPDLVLLNVTLPHMDGFSLCRTLRRSSAVPILMLADQERGRDRVRGLDLGADGYIVKPFSSRELLARVRAMLRRRKLNRDEIFPLGDRIEVGDIVLDRTTRQVWRGGRPIRLRQREFDLLSTLMENAGKAVPRQELLGQVWGEDWVGNSRTLDVHIRWLREKVEEVPSAPRYIQTVRGYGHRFLAPNTAQVEAG